MLDVDALCKALAANLATIDQTQISAYLLDNPTPRALSIAGFEEIDYVQTFGPDASWTVVIEGCVHIGAAGDVAAQKMFRRWLAPTGPDSVKEASQSDRHLTSRLLTDGTIETGQDPLADDVALRTFRGYRRGRLPNGTDVLLGDFLVQVETSE